MPIDYSLTDDGLTTPRLQDALARVIELWRSKFGENAQVSGDTPDGLEIAIWSILDDLGWQANAEVWNDSFFRTCGDTALDLILDLFGRKRLDAASSTVSGVWFGTDTTVVPVDSQVSTEQDDRFESDEAATVGTDDLAYVVRVETSTDATYRVTVNADDRDFVASGNTITEIRDGLISAINGSSEPVTALSGGLDADGYGLIVLDSSDESALTVAVSIAAGSGTLNLYDAVRVGMTCTATGPIAALAGTMQTIETTIGGIEGFTTTVDATPGRDRETSEEFRVRHLANLNSNGSGTAKSIEDYIAENVDLVTEVSVRENRDDITDGDGLPPHSFETLVIGGTDADVAAAIYAKGPAGIRAYGQESEVVTDAKGKDHDIGFTRPTPLYLHVELTITTGEGWSGLGDPATTIKAAVAAALASGTTKLTRGRDVYRAQVAAYTIAAKLGIANVVVRLDTTAAPEDSPAFAAADITVAEDEIAIADSSRITTIGI